MRRFSILLFLAFLNIFPALSFSSELTPQVSAIAPLERISALDKILILAPHPDDETIACGGVIQQAVKVGAKVKIVYLTNGDNNELAFIVYEKRLTFKRSEFLHMGQVRRQEASEAMKFLGLKEEDLIFLGYPDFGLFTLFSEYWNNRTPFTSMLTHVSAVPYKENPSFGSAYLGESVLNDLKNILITYAPNKIFVSHPADVNADHRAVYLFLQAALEELKNKPYQPKVYPYLVHSRGWPLPRHYHPALELLPPKKFSDSLLQWQRYDLTPEQLEKKYQAILRYRSQTSSSAFYLLSFVRKDELFGDYPAVELPRQISLREQGPSFFGFSKMYAESDVEWLEDIDSLVEGTGAVSYAVVDDALVVRIEQNKAISRRFSLMLYLFGYSNNKDFVSMPKLRIIVKANHSRVFDGQKLISSDGLSSHIEGKSLLIKIPLPMLGNPDSILTAIKAYWGIAPHDGVGFRRIVIKGQKGA